MSEVFLCKRGAIDARSRGALKKAGIIVVEADDPSQCQFIRAGEIVSHDDMLWACLDALNLSGSYGSKSVSQRERFVENILSIAVSRRAEKEATS